MSIKYSASTQGFYTDEITYPALPTDLVEITSDKHQELLAGQSTGLRIIAGNDGYPTLVNPPDLLSLEERLAQTKAIKQTEIEQACHQALAAGIEYAGQRYATDLTAQTTLLTAQQMASMTQETYPVQDVDGNAHTLTADQLTQLLKIVAAHYRQVTQHAQALREQLTVIQTQEAVAALSIGFL